MGAGIREQTLRLMREQPKVLKLSLDAWISASCTRTINNLLYGLRGIKIGEFQQLYWAESLTDAIV